MHFYVKQRKDGREVLVNSCIKELNGMGLRGLRAGVVLIQELEVKLYRSENK